MNRFVAAIGFALALGAPLHGFAMQNTSYDLRQGNVNARWEGKGSISMQQEPNGILLTSGAETGTFLTTELPKFMPEGVTLFVTSAQNANVRFMWTKPNNLFNAIDISIQAQNTESLSLSLRANAGWRGPIRSIGFLLPPHTQILLNRMDLMRWSPGEKLRSVLKTFFMPDEYRPYSINFVWGPVIGLNPVEMHSVFLDLPPQQIYATYALNILLVIILAILILWARYRVPAGQRKTAVIRAFAIVAIAVWILMDLRMGWEFLSWVRHDRSTYIAAPASSRTFRDRGQFYDFATFVKPYLSDRSSYIFFAEQAWPYLGNMRYLTYPSIPGIDVEHDDTWVIFGRGDVTLNEFGQLAVDGSPVSEPGKILARFDDESFVFRTFAPPSPQ